jgi:glutamate formiminotransferase/formiminotetrahydrofolate cyclodeaminase
MTEAGKFYLKKQKKSAGVPEKELVETAIRSLGLAQLGPFDPHKKIIEYTFRQPMPLMSLPVWDFTDEVSSDSPAPGGGSVAALAGALSAALTAMVANLTVGKKGYEHVWEELSALSEKAQTLKDQLNRAVDEDTQAFTSVMDAMRLPKETAAQQTIRAQAIEEGYKKAVAVPLQTAKTCQEAMKLCLIVAEKGNTNSASDAGVAAIMARAGLEGACLNVLINLGSIKDEPFAASQSAQLDSLLTESTALCRNILAIVRKNIGR